MFTALGVLVYVLGIGGKLRNFSPRKNEHKRALLAQGYLKPKLSRLKVTPQYIKTCQNCLQTPAGLGKARKFSHCL